ncbi:hypothetical protein CVT26_014807 [Gymnopilus dilepis]|uniref:Uncharacterized protein n=1 Tax=Gymnopilus dilepis TaxID=231916 RepID=A0A409W3W9_9AGAR|nr:hypothetical protein CVT26_014807 [Gymnopilus dilepis]
MEEQDEDEDEEEEATPSPSSRHPPAQVEEDYLQLQTTTDGHSSMPAAEPDVLDTQSFPPCDGAPPSFLAQASQA